MHLRNFSQKLLLRDLWPFLGIHVYTAVVVREVLNNCIILESFDLRGVSVV